MTLQLDFARDLRSQLLHMLKASGVEIDPSLAAWDVAVRFYDFRLRCIAPRPRDVVLSTELAARSPSLPASLRDGMSAIDEDSRLGRDLSRYRSRTWNDLNLQDPLFNDWGIHHFHLGGRDVESDGFVKRTGPLLYTLCASDALYFIDILDHGAFAHQELIEVIHNNWRSLIAHAACPEVSGYTKFTNDARRQLSRNRAKGNGLLLIEVSDGTVYMPPAGGLMTSGHNLHVITCANSLLNEVHALEGRVRSAQEQLVDAIADQTGRSPPAAEPPSRHLIGTSSSHRDQHANRDSVSELVVRDP